MDKNLRHAISIGRKPTYCANIIEATELATKLAQETGTVHGVQRNGRSKKFPFYVRQGYHQGTGSNANVFVAYPQREGHTGVTDTILWV